jgi:hypothetical protein
MLTLGADRFQQSGGSFAFVDKQRAVPVEALQNVG